MFQKPIKKTIFTLAVDNFSEEITAMTFPLMEAYAQRIGADFHVIRERRFKDWPVTYEKLQVFRLAQEMANDWNIFFDADTLIHPETLDWTLFLPKDTVVHNGMDMAAIRWDYDRYFWRVGRHIGSCNWCAIASDWCVDLWTPLDIPLEEALRRIHPRVVEGTKLRFPLMEDGK